MMLTERVGRMMVAFHDERNPTDDEWNQWIEACRQVGSEGGCCVVQSLGGAPSAAQRRALADKISRGIKTVVLTRSAVSRGIVKAVSWLGISVRAYDFDQVHEIQGYLGLTPEEYKSVEATLARLMSQCNTRTGTR